MTPPRVDRNVGQDGIDILVLNYRNQAGGQACSDTERRLRWDGLERRMRVVR